MPITGTRKNPLSSLTGDEHRKLATIIAELQSRGIDVSDRIERLIQSWPIASNGYLANNQGKLYSPTPAQEAFISSNARFVGFMGGRGSGKSASGAQKALFKIRKGEHGAVLNPDFENFKTSTWPEFKSWIPWNMVIPKQQFRSEPGWEPLQPFSITFLTGAKVICKGVKEPDSARGPNINWLWYDEGSRDDSGLSWKIAIASVRVGKEPQAWITATPNPDFGTDHWAYKFFVEQDIPEEAIKAFEEAEGELSRELVEFYQGSIEDNKQNLDPGFYASMVAAYSDDPFLKKIELDGLFVNRGAVLGDRSWFDGKIISKIPDDVHIEKRVRYWDLAATEKKMIKKRKLDPDETTGTLLDWDGGKTFYIEDQVAGTGAWDWILDLILNTALRDGPIIEIRIEQEPGSGGKNQIAAIKKHLEDKIKEKLGYMPSYTIKEHVPEGDKIVRANIWFAEAKQGQFWMLKGDWNTRFLTQLDGFPGGRFDDRIDGTSGARLCVAPIVLWSNIEFMVI